MALITLAEDHSVEKMDGLIIMTLVKMPIRPIMTFKITGLQCNA